MDKNTDIILANATKSENWEDQEKTTDDVAVLREQFKKRLHSRQAEAGKGNEAAPGEKTE